MNDNQSDNHNPTEPVAPDSLPNYLKNGVKKQDIDTLSELKEYVDDVITYRSQPVSNNDLPREAEQVNYSDSDVQGTVLKELVKCGDESCACTDKSPNKSDKHGPYLYRYYYQNGRLKSEYLGKP